MDLTEGSETIFFIKPLKMDLTEGSETIFFIKPLKMDLTEGSETIFFIKPLKMDLTEGSETIFFIKPLKMDMTEGSETSAKLNLTPEKYPKENIQEADFVPKLLSSSLALVSEHMYQCMCTKLARRLSLASGRRIRVRGAAILSFAHF
jgi:hypothetical protein